VLLLRWTGGHMIRLDAQVDPGPARFSRWATFTRDIRSAEAHAAGAAYLAARDPALERWRRRESARPCMWRPFALTLRAFQKE
jgi:hypothetical protein